LSAIIPANFVAREVRKRNGLFLKV
jgi:hypothetical protein